MKRHLFLRLRYRWVQNFEGKMWKSLSKYSWFILLRQVSSRIHRGTGRSMYRSVAALWAPWLSFHNIEKNLPLFSRTISVFGSPFSYLKQINSNTVWKKKMFFSLLLTLQKLEFKRLGSCFCHFRPQAPGLFTSSPLDWRREALGMKKKGYENILKTASWPTDWTRVDGCCPK